ncbi:protein CFAP20DC isoform X3 [Trachinotus anak]|uniref:protein CFAP20DC isoform X3 n=1 Tax=Trachinotus anak TaxID=443729 RepID=UPI0039F20A38
MFRNNYQGGAVVEIFSGQGKDPVAKWKLCGGPSAIYKEYNKEVKGFVYCLEGSSPTVKMQMPESGKMSLGLLQRFLVLQVNIPQCKDFSVELVCSHDSRFHSTRSRITDSEHLKRRLHLSTVHKELSATLLHAKIPFVGLKRNIWSTLCLDLVSFTAELFKGFLTLDGITLFATCKVRRIFTMKTEPTRMSDDDMFLSGAGLTDLIPRSCQFPPDVNHVTQMLNMENVQKAEMRTGLLNSDCVPDQSGTARSTSYQQTRPQGVLQTASGSRASGLPPQTTRKSSAASDGQHRNVPFISNTGSPFSRRNQKVSAESQSIAKLSENLSHGEPSLTVHGGTPGRLQPHPPADKQGSRKIQVFSAGKERLASSANSDAVPGHHRQRSKTREKCTPPSSRQEGRQQPVILTEKTKHLTADEVSAAKESSRAALNPAESLPCSIRPGLSSDLQVWSSWESNEGSEPQLTLQEEVFIFSSQPHSPKRGQGQGDQEKMEMGDDQVQSKSGRRCEAQPEDDFIGSESDEDKSYTTFQQQRSSVEPNPATPRTPDRMMNVHVKIHPKSHMMDQTSPKEFSPATTNTHTQFPSSGRAELVGMVPTRCLSPSVTMSRQENKCGPRGSEVVNQVVDGNSSVTISRRFLHEVKLAESLQHKEEEDKKLEPVDTSHYDLHLLGSLRMHGDDDEELRMLASLKREQEEDECSASGLSASQIHQCNVSISMSSDDTSTWTHFSMPANQGHHYQNEINPLLHSNPREWMDVLSPPIMPPSPRRRSKNTWNNRENQVGGGADESLNEEGEEDEYLNLLYDPCLNCYFDPKTGKYYELA